jgi:ribosome-binding factor A
MSIRQDKVSELIKREIGEILRAEGGRLTAGKMVSVTVVRMSPALGFAKTYVSIFPSANAKADLESIRKHASELRGKLGKKVGKQLRVVPEIAFFLDDSLDYADRINRLLD